LSSSRRMLLANRAAIACPWGRGRGRALLVDRPGFEGWVVQRRVTSRGYEAGSLPV
jgi:hypothetical protein